MSSAEPLHRSYLYAPGSRPDVMRKAFGSGADAVVLDLEDAVPAGVQAQARSNVAALLDEVALGDPGGPTHPDIHVRINRDGAGYAVADVDAVVRPGLDAIRLPKVESVEAVREVADHLERLERERALAVGCVRLYLAVESALGVLASAGTLTASPRVARAAIGIADLLADLGAAGDDELATLHARSELVLRSRAADVGPPIDSVHTELDDDEGLRAGARRARALGFHGKSVIHPRQLAAVHEVFTPSDDELRDAERIVAALDASERRGEGAVALDGRFVDAAVAARARGVLARRRPR